MSTQPNTIVQLPPSYQRSLAEKVILLFCGVAVPLTILGLLYRAAGPSPEPFRLPVDAPAASPVDRNVEAWNGLTPIVFVQATELPTVEPTERPTAAPLPTTVFCNSQVPLGDVCTMPFVIPSPTEVLPCSDEAIAGGDVCRWMPTPETGGLFK